MQSSCRNANGDWNPPRARRHRRGGAEGVSVTTAIGNKGTPAGCPAGVRSVSGSSVVYGAQMAQAVRFQLVPFSTPLFTVTDHALGDDG